MALEGLDSYSVKDKGSIGNPMHIGPYCEPGVAGGCPFTVTTPTALLRVVGIEK